MAEPSSVADHTDRPATTSHVELPSIAAAYQVAFDLRKGYVLTWQKSSRPDLKLEDAVEFKSLPSGLHNISEDLIYFVHEDCAGISAYLKQSDQHAERNARMIAVGVLVPRDQGKIGKSWLYADALRELAAKQIADASNHALLEEFWEEYGQHGKVEEKSSELEQTDEDTDEEEQGYRKPRALSITSLGLQPRTLPANHPALALPQLLRTFGPLIFPVIRACLSQKRILILGDAPVETACNHVYNISILSSISRAAAFHLPQNETSKLRSQPLFNVGIHDIPFLESQATPWVACTTDDVLCSKPKLFDLLVILPSTTTPLHQTGNKIYPRLIISTPDLAQQFPKQGLRATRRDARRYQSLRSALAKLPSSGTTVSVRSTSVAVNEDDPLLDNNESPGLDDAEVPDDTQVDHAEAIEPLPWTVVAYTSLIWWVSAGDSRSGLLADDEHDEQQDEDVLRETCSDDNVTKEVATISYFHILTSLIFQILDSIISRHGVGHQYRDDEIDNEDDRLVDDSKEQPIDVTEEDVRAMGLDVWSTTDREFIKEMMKVWYQREANVSRGVVECCGIRIL